MSSPRSPRNEPTLATVAAVAGVSPATVSRVINGTPTVAAPIRQAVEVAIDQLGYVPNRAARSLVTRRTDSIAFIMREPVEFGVADPYLSSMLIAASQSLTGTGVQLVVMLAQNDADHAQVAHYARGGHVDGVILVSVHDDDPLPGQLARARVPFVVSGRPPTPMEGSSYVDVDNSAGAVIATERLISSGRKRIAMLAGPRDMTAAVDRLAGFRTAVEVAGLSPVAVMPGSFTRESGATGMRELLAAQPDVDAVFAANDLMALGALTVLRAEGRQVPGDVALIGFDDIEIAQHSEPALTTIRQPVAEVAREMTREVLRQIDGLAPAGPCIMEPILVERSTV